MRIAIFFKTPLTSPYREYVVSSILGIALLFHYTNTFGGLTLIWVGALLGTIVPLLDTIDAIKRRTITIEAFNFLALVVSFATGQVLSAAFIALMLAFASYLDWRTESRATNAVEELLKLKPNKAERVEGDKTVEITSAEIKRGDILIVKIGGGVPADGVVTYGSAFVNEASLTGESVPREVIIGDQLYSGTIIETGVIKMRATNVGSDTTIDRMARLVLEASKKRSKAQRLADKFAGIFLPIVMVIGVLTYIVTHNISMTVAFFLIVCADDIAVSIPLAMTASLGRAAKRGVIIKGGEWIDAFAKTKIIVFDKTGTLTYGKFTLEHAEIVPGIDEKLFWGHIAIAEKYSEHPVGRTLFKEAIKHMQQEDIQDPDEIKVIKGGGIWVRIGSDEVVLGNQKALSESKLIADEKVISNFKSLEGSYLRTVLMVFINKEYAGIIAVGDTPKIEAKRSIERIRELGIRVIMLTGDNVSVAQDVSAQLGITEFRAGMTPEGKLLELEKLAKEGKLAMVGDGVNDAPALARADTGIAMGSGGTAVAVETANIIILTDELDRIPEMIVLARRTVSVVNLDMIIWAVTNIVGVGLVFTGIAGPVFAAIYNFATDFLPLLNSARLFHTPLEENAKPQ